MKVNLQAAILPIVGSVFLTYSELRKDWDDKPETNSETSQLVVAWSTALGFLFGTTTVGQTRDIAQEEVKK